jgi:hypothetical protein
MAWRPSEYLIAGELDNTTPGKVTGWMRFAGLKHKVTFDLNGDFHRDIRGAKVRLTGEGQEGDAKATGYMKRFATKQAGEVGDMTAGREPRDYVEYPYFEWYSEENGRVVIELDSDQVEVIGQPIPACESDPISREKQAQNMARFLAGLSRDAGVTAIAPMQPLVSDPSFTHWVVAEGQIIGEARKVQAENNGTCFAYVRLFDCPECVEYGRIERKHLQEKDAGPGCGAPVETADPTAEVKP